MHKTNLITGFIYRIYDSAAYDKVVCLISENGTKVACLAKGVKKQNSRKSHSIDIGNNVKIKIVEGYKVPIISEIKLVDENLNWKKDYQNLIILQLISEIIGNLIAEENEEPRLYKALKNVINSEFPNKRYLLAIFMLQVLLFSGNLPKLNECTQSGQKVESENCFKDPNTIGYNSLGIGKPVSPRTFKIQRFIEKSGLYSALKLQITSKDVDEMLKIHTQWIEILLEKELKAKKFLSSGL